MPHPPTYYKWAVVMCCLLSALSNGISSLSCTECTASDEASCTGELETRERCKDLGIVYNRCKCCPQCGRKRGASCSDEKRCAPGLLCEIRPLGVGDDGFPETIAMKSNVCVEGLLRKGYSGRVLGLVSGVVDGCRFGCVIYPI